MEEVRSPGEPQQEKEERPSGSGREEAATGQGKMKKRITATSKAQGGLSSREAQEPHMLERPPTPEGGWRATSMGRAILQRAEARIAEQIAEGDPMSEAAINGVRQWQDEEEEGEPAGKERARRQEEPRLDEDEAPQEADRLPVIKKMKVVTDLN